MKDCNPLDVLSQILDDQPDMVFAYSPGGKYLYINRSAAEFLGDDPLDVIGCDWEELGYPEEIMRPLIGAVAGVAESREPASHRVTTSVARGSRTLDIVLTPLACDGEVIAVLAICHDISEFF